jgi:hypothetical protein
MVKSLLDLVRQLLTVSCMSVVAMGGRMEKDSSKPEVRRYPPFWERAVPIVVGVIAVLVVGLAVVAASVALGIFPYGG